MKKAEVVTPLKRLFEETARKAIKSGNSRFCAPLAISLVTGLDFDRVNHTMLARRLRKSKDKGVGTGDIFKTLNILGMKYERVKRPAKAKTAISLVGTLDINKKYLVFFSGHVAAYMGGEVVDWVDGKRNRVLKIYEVY